MAKRTKADQRLHETLAKVLPKVATLGITEGSWERGAEALVKALAVYDYVIGVDPALEAATRPATRKPQARGVHPHGIAESWRADGKCVVRTCNVYRNAVAASGTAAQPAVAPAVFKEPRPAGRVTYRVTPAGTVYELPSGEDIVVGGPAGANGAGLKRLQELGLGEEFWELEPTKAEVCGALGHVLGLET